MLVESRGSANTRLGSHCQLRALLDIASPANQSMKMGSSFARLAQGVWWSDHGTLWDWALALRRPDLVVQARSHARFLRQAGQPHIHGASRTDRACTTACLLICVLRLRVRAPGPRTSTVTLGWLSGTEPSGEPFVPDERISHPSHRVAHELETLITKGASHG